MSSDLSKIISKKWESGRDINDVRHRTSTRVRELRRSRRSAVLNGLRQVADTRREPKKVKTAVEEKLERLQAYKREKIKRMEELKKNQKPPFQNFVLSRHTGGTPFRRTGRNTKQEPIVRKPLVLPTNTRSITEVQKPVVAKPVYNLRTVMSRFADKHDDKKPISKDKPNTIGLPAVTKSNKPGISVTKKQPIKQSEPKKTERKTGKENVLEQKIAVRKPLKENATVNKKTENKTGKENVTKKQQRAVQPMRNNLRPVQPKRNNLNPSVVKNEIQIAGNADTGRRVLRSRENISDKVNVVTSAQGVKKTTTSRKPVIKPSLPARQLRRRPNSQQDSNPSTSSESDSNIENVGPKVENIIEALDHTCLTDGACVHTPEINEGSEGTNGTDFYRKSLQETIDRLNIEADIWDKKKEENMPEQMKDEILAVVGQTRLLIAQRFRKFRGLIDRCDLRMIQDQCLNIVTLEDLEGYWEVMYQQVDQLDRKYRNLVELEINNWEDKTVVKPKKTIKKAAPKKISNKPTTSRFKEFLRGKQNKGEEPSSPTPIPVTPSKSDQISAEDDTLCSLYMSASKGEEEFGHTNLASLKTPTRTPAVQRVLDNCRRRSSIALLTVKQAHLMKLPSPQN